MLKYIIFILIFCNLCYAQNFDIQEISDRQPVEKLPMKRETPIEPKKQIIIKQSSESIQDPVKKDEKDLAQKIKVNVTNKNGKQEKSESVDMKINKNETVTTTEKELFKNDSLNTVENINKPNFTSQHPGAALRGFYVFLGLSVLIIMYFLFKAFRLRPGAAPPATVRKYGIVGRRSDMEMLPLPLAEEEDDDTLFDMGTQMNR